MEAIYIEKGNIRRGIELKLVDDEEAEWERLEHLNYEWHLLLNRIGSIDEWALEELCCSRSSFYEVLLNEYKNRLIALQGGLDRDNKYRRK